MEFNVIIRNLREDNDLTQKEIATIFNTTQRRISRIENKETEPTIQDIKQYCLYFNLSADYLLGLSEKKKLK